jgi:AraC family transcriptional regulator
MAHQPSHVHALPSVSVLLSGRLREEAGRAEVSVCEGAVCLKPEGLRHCNLYGPEGAAILSIAIEDAQPWEHLAPCDWHWSQPRSNRFDGLLGLLRNEAPGFSSGDALIELLAISRGAEAREGVPPLWLRRLRMRLDDDPNVSLGMLAADAEVHPVYLSRAFASWYGTSPSAYRSRRRVSKVIHLCLTGSAGSAAAHEAGFADQSHMLKSVSRWTGYSLPALRKLHGLSR